MALVSSADSFPPCLDFKLGRNYVVFLGNPCINHFVQLWVKTWLSTKLDGQPLPSCALHIQFYVQLICTVPNIQLCLVLFRCKKSSDLLENGFSQSFLSIYIRGEAHIQLYVQLICTVPNIQLFLVLLRCKKSHNLFSIFIIFSN